MKKNLRPMCTATLFDDVTGKVILELDMFDFDFLFGDLYENTIKAEFDKIPLKVKREKSITLYF